MSLPLSLSLSLSTSLSLTSLSTPFNLVFGLHDRSVFDVTCYALSAPDGSTWRQKIESEVETFRDISQLHSGDAAQLINNDGIHILINLNGYTKGSKNEIFALQPAPIQVREHSSNIALRIFQ